MLAKSIIFLDIALLAGMWLDILGILCRGTARLAAAEPLTDENHIAFYNGREDVSISSVVIDEPEIRDRAIQLKIKTKELESQDSQIEPVTGFLLVTAPRYPTVPYGARIRVTGTPQEPKIPPTLITKLTWPVRMYTPKSAGQR